MIRFNNDYNHGAHPKILEALQRTNGNAYGGYGEDEICQKAREKLRNVVGNKEVDVHFLVGGTQVNYVALEACMPRPYYSVISADTGHINVHESGAIENTGHKIHTLAAKDGKITAEQIVAEADYYHNNPLHEHVTYPKAVYISFPTEYGTTYSKSELKDIRRVCDEYNMYLYIDGARLGYGLAATDNDVSIEDLTQFADAYYIGGTKCGFLMGEALIIRNPELKEGIRNYMKMNGALLAKGWLLGLQFITMFQDGLYFEITANAVGQAEKIRSAMNAKGYHEYIKSNTNQLFYIMSNQMIDKLSKDFHLEVMDPIDEESAVIRICTSWSTTDKEVDSLIERL